MRPTKDEYFIAMAKLAASRSTCLRRAVGCVLVNARGHTLATGYNGRAAGQPHCNEAVYFGKREAYLEDPSYPNACAGARAETGTQLDACEAIHAEQNALLQCRDAYAIDTCYTTASPCLTCVKLLMNTSCRRIVFLDEYPHAEARALWLGSSSAFAGAGSAREWVKEKLRRDLL